MRGRRRSVLCFGAGLLLSVLPPVAATLCYFPLWRTQGDGKILSGTAILLLTLAAVPLFRVLKRWLASPSAPLLWGIGFLLFLMLSRIAEEMTVISFFGWMGNLAGALFFRLARCGEKPEREGKDGT